VSILAASADTICDEGATKCVADAMVTVPKTHGPDTRLREIRALFDDDHVHMALIVAADGRLLTTIERADLSEAIPGSNRARHIGGLVGRTISPYRSLELAKAALKRGRRRRLAVIDDSGRLLGLLCLKRTGDGFCSDEGVRQRAAEMASATLHL
jgi:CBS-domain-containing membrane protein